MEETVLDFKNKPMFKMLQTMRWFGPQDSTTLADIRQSGAEGIVTALHQIPTGELWSVEDIKKRQQMIQEAGLQWSVVESIPVHPDIQRKVGNFHTYIENYKQSILNLAAAGIKIVTYNFMPVLDWVRTNHHYQNPDGSSALGYHRLYFIYFDVFLLKRPGSKNEYTKQELADAEALGSSLSEPDRDRLFKNVLLGLPGSSENFTADKLLELLQGFKDITASHLQENLIAFLKEIVPVASACGVQLAIHPDDPPFSVLGLPRVVSTQEDLERIFSAVPELNNGLCYCTGSLGADPKNDLTAIINRFGDRIHFLHLRNVQRDGEHIFRESPHLEGSNSINEIMEKLVLLMQQRKLSIPMRPDHGFMHNRDKDITHYPGYSLIGRLKGLAELRGLEQGILYNLNQSNES